MRVVLTSVRYADFLAATLAAWKAIVPTGCLTVATSLDDVESQAIADEHAVPFVATSAWTEVDPEWHAGGEPTFNMGHGLNVALGLSGDLVAPPRDGELIGHVNPDCYPFGIFPAERTFDRGVLYGFWRHACESPKALQKHVSGRTDLGSYPKMKNTGGMPVGYCQFFRAEAGKKFPSYPTAGKFDTAFARSFPRTQMRPELYMLHLGPSDVKSNWAGRTVPQWVTA